MLWPIVCSLIALAEPAPAAVHRLAGTAFGEPVELEVMGLAPEVARAALAAAVAAIGQVERLADPAAVPAGGVAELNAAAGAGPRPVDPILLPLLARARDFCHWSERVHGPLGGELYALWGLRRRALALPLAAALAQAVETAGCDRLALDAAAGTAALAAGSTIELWGFAVGHAADRAVEALRAQGAASGLVRVGPVRRGFGDGPAGKGWRIALPPVEGLAEPLSPVWLRDRALAVVESRARPLAIAGDSYAPFINQRTGRPAEGAVAVVAVGELGADAEALAVTMLLTGPREGQLRLGSLRPQPSVLWILGSGAGPPLLVDHRWARVPTR